MVILNISVNRSSLILYYVASTANRAAAAERDYYKDLYEKGELINAALVNFFFSFYNSNHIFTIRSFGWPDFDEHH